MQNDTYGNAAAFFRNASPIIAGATGIANIGGTLGNFALQLSNLKYQKDLQKTLFEREDNAVQRRVHDLEAAGLSPVREHVFGQHCPPSSKGRGISLRKNKSRE